MTSQLQLSFPSSRLAGQHLRPMIDSETIGRLARQHGCAKTGHFYCLQDDSGHALIWSGRGQRPRWVVEWIERGGTLQQIEAQI